MNGEPHVAKSRHSQHPGTKKYVQLVSQIHHRGVLSMRSVVLGALGCVASLVPSIMALNVPRSNYAVPELLIIPNNLTLMTPRDTSSMLERQLLDFGSPFSGGFSGLRHLATRQGCNAATEVCPNDPTTCCQAGGECCGGGICCRAGSFCYGGGCCLSSKVGCDNKGCCDRGANCCTGGGCCASGSHCVTINGSLGCCPDGQTCVSELQCNRTGFSPCANETFCCQTGFVCSRDPTNQPLCSDPNAQTGTPTSAQPSPTTTRTAISHTPPTTQTDQPIVPGGGQTGTSVQATGTAQTTQYGGSGDTLAPSKSTTNAGAIAGGTVAGVVALALIVMFLVVWRRRKPSGAANSETPVGDEHPASGPPYNNEYSPDVAPPTPVTADPFLTPMNQQPNVGVSYFAGPNRPDRPASAGSSPHYTGLPEPQHGDGMGVAVGTTAMPVPRHNLHDSRSLSMTVTPVRTPSPESGPNRLSGFMPPSGLNAADAGRNTPRQTLNRLSNHESANHNSVYSSPPGGNNTTHNSTPPPRAPSN
ncbi:unnamed protein product [Rhizoctonia solani]|uniref:Uncharacterized protein n=1 Tax=Rhizoctonia solani TaxID=456999 RepID=A0A8H3HUQ9_9AGAM|nr:unnamed protein product [Rhizoctonia solani]